MICFVVHVDGVEFIHINKMIEKLVPLVVVSRIIRRICIASESDKYKTFRVVVTDLLDETIKLGETVDKFLILSSSGHIDVDM